MLVAVVALLLCYWYVQHILNMEVSSDSDAKAILVEV